MAPDNLLHAIVVEEVGNGHDGNALVGQFLALLRRGNPANGAFRRLPLMHQARFLGKPFAHVFGGAYHAAQLLQHLCLNFMKPGLLFGGTCIYYLR